MVLTLYIYELNMNKINVNRVIPTELITQSASNQLYRIGLLYTRSQYEQGAIIPQIYHPRLINSILGIYLTQVVLVTFIVPNEYRIIKIMFCVLHIYRAFLNT